MIHNHIISTIDWIRKSEPNPTTLEELQEILLSNRGVEDKDAYFDPKSPHDLSLDEVGIDEIQMKNTIKRLKTAHQADEKIVIYGDYDVDGMCATSILWRTLAGLGYKVLPFIPDREKHGYGLSPAGINSVIELYQPTLIITVDNGIVAGDAVADAVKKNIEVIVTDHHKIDEDAAQLDAVSIIHTTQLCGTTVAWMLAREICSAHASTLKEITASSQLDLCALATATDMVPLTAANRSFAFHGLEAIRQSQRPGIKALVQTAQIEQHQITVGSLGFTLGPRLNAAGRLAEGIDGVRLLCTNSIQKATEIAFKLNKLNFKRKDLTDSQTELAVGLAEEILTAHPERAVIVVSSDEFHEGVIGLIAGNLVEKFHRPSIVIALGEKTAKGSARSVSGVDVTEIMRSASELLTSVGGHAAAGGLSIKSENLAKFKQKMAAYEIDLPRPEKSYDCDLPLELLREDILEMMARFEPFGIGNPGPKFKITIPEDAERSNFGRTTPHQKIVFQVVGAGGPVELINWSSRYQIQDTAIIKPIKLGYRGGVECYVVGV